MRVMLTIPAPDQPGSRTEIEILASLVEEAYRGAASSSLLANLRDLREEDWIAAPPGGCRSIADILEHAGWCKWMYEDYAFGSAMLRGDQPPLVPADNARARDELLAWMDAGHARWLASIRALPDDVELDRLRLANWGEQLPTRELIRILIAHDIYHAGEINHIRAVL
jgi:uncharacterized damage-inducible protein DinB